MQSRSRRFGALGIAATLLVVGCSGDDDGSTNASTLPFGERAPTEPMDDADARDIDTAAEETFESLEGEAPALYLGVWDPDKGVFTQAYGSAVIDGADATRDDSLRIGTMTSSFTATIVLQLVREGEVELDETVGTYAPDLVARIPELADITVEQLLSMASGLPDYLNRPGGVVAEIVADTTRVWTPEELVREAVSLGPEPPGTRAYSNTNFVVLQLIVEAVTDQPLGDLIAARITDPLDIGDTTLPPDDDTALPAPAGHGYLNEACVEELAADGASGLAVNTDTTAWNTSFGQGAGGMISTLADMGAWAETTMGNTSLSRGLGNDRIETRALPTGLQYGLGIIRFGDWYGHAGEALGWESLGLHNTKTGVTFVAAANACKGAAANFVELLETLYPEDEE